MAEKKHAVQGVTVAMNQPLNLQGFDRYEEYVEFYSNCKKIGYDGETGRLVRGIFISWDLSLFRSDLRFIDSPKAYIGHISHISYGFPVCL